MSATLDGEDPGGDLAAVLRHQATCAECAVWARTWHAAASRTRMVTAEPVPDLTDRIVAAVVADRATARRRLHLPTRLALVLVAMAQLVATTPFLLFGHDQAAPVHLARELGSFGVAVSLGLLVAAAWPSLAAGSLPVLAASGGLLAVTAGLDIAAGRADAIAELPHLLPSVGVLLLCRLAMTWTPPTDGSSVNRVGPALRHLAARLVAPLQHRPSLGLHVLHAVSGVRRLGAVAVLAAGIAVAAAVPAAAHATLESSTPASGTVVTQAPSTLALHFDETVSVVPGSIKVVGPDGKRVDDGQARHPGGRGADLAVGLQQRLAGGSYLVAWRVVSADSHPVSGAFVFSVGAAGPTASKAALQSTSSAPVGWLLGAARFLGYAGLALLGGGVLFLLACWPAGWSLRRAGTVLAAGWLSLTVGTAVALIGKGAYDAGAGLSAIGRPSLLREVLATPYGQALRLRLVVLVLVLMWWAWRGRLRAVRPAWPVAGAALAVALLLSFAQSGHANAGSQRPLALASDALHLAAMATWLGGLVMLGLVLLAASGPTDAGRAVSRFSRVAAGSVGVLVVTGTYQSWRQVGSFAALPATTYGRLLLVKLGLVVAVLVAAGLSRAWVRRHYRALPVVHASVDADRHTAPAAPQVTAGRRELSVLRRSVGAELLLAVVVLAVTAALVAVQPARSAYRPSVDANVRLGPVTAQVSGVPTGTRHMDLHLYTFTRAGEPTAPAEVTAELRLPAQNLGPLRVPLQPAGPGHWLATVDVPLRGDWDLQVTARTSEFDSYSGSVTLPLR
ncbi:MAG: copper transport protein [Actinomycetota bacterium]|nr:copper transport protein [Actinomycetota bacterium]